MKAKERSARNKRFYSWAAQEGRGMRCEVPGCNAPAQFHHVLVPALGRRGHALDAFNVVKVCMRHHQTGGGGVAVHSMDEETWAERHLPAPLWLLLFLRLARYARHLEEQIEGFERQSR